MKGGGLRGALQMKVQADWPAPPLTSQPRLPLPSFCSAHRLAFESLCRCSLCEGLQRVHVCLSPGGRETAGREPVADLADPTLVWKQGEHQSDCE